MKYSVVFFEVSVFIYSLQCMNSWFDDILVIDSEKVIQHISNGLEQLGHEHNAF